MDTAKFFHNHRSLVLSSLYLTAGLLTAGYAVFYSNLSVSAADLRIATNRLQADNVELQRHLREVEDEQQQLSASQEKRLTSMPDFLARINRISNSQGVIIRRLSPDEQSRTKFNIEIMSDYETVLKFTTGLETLDTVLNDMQIRPYDTAAVPPVHYVTFSITPRGNADALQSERLASLRATVAETGKRNPFQRHAPGEQAIELTWLYKLSGIGRDQDGRVANINRHDYRVGDLLEDKRIVDIQADRVFLEAKGKQGLPQKYVLKPRPLGGG